MGYKYILKGRVKTLLKIFALVLALLLPAAGCMEKKDKGDIVIGVVWPFASNNNLFREGVELAAKEVNENGGVNGRRIQLALEDDQASVTTGMAVAQSFAKNPQITAVIGHRNSFVSVPAARIYEEAGKVMLSPASTAPELTRKGYRYIFRDLPDDDDIAREVAYFAFQQGHRRMVIYYAEDSYGIGLANAFEDHAKTAGIKIVDRITYYGDQKDLERLRNKWKALDFDGIFVACGMPDGAEFIADCGRVGTAVPFFAGNAMDSPLLAQIGGSTAEGMMVGTTFRSEDPREDVKVFIQNFTSAYRQPPGPYTAQGYDAVKLLAAAIERAGSADSAAIAGQLRKMENWPGAAGYHSFDDNGNDTADLVVIKTLRDGRLQEYK